jgi:hypothetical protein
MCALRLLQKNGAWALKNFGLTEQEIRQLDTLLTPEGNLAGFYLDIEEAIPATWGRALRKQTIHIDTNSNPLYVV